jgi:hypothetical protein
MRIRYIYQLIQKGVVAGVETKEVWGRGTSALLEFEFM